MHRINDALVTALPRLNHWHQKRVLGGLSRLGLTCNLPINGFRVLLDPRHDYVQWQMVSNGAWEKPVEELIGEVSRGSRLIFDVGANIGYFSLLSARRMPPGSTVVAFEPFPPNYEVLLKNVALNDLRETIRCEKVALASASGPVRLYYSDEGSNCGTPSMLDGTGAGGASIPARSVALDSYREEHFPGADVDLVKIDVEGGEFEVLLGMEAGLEDGRYRRVVLELHPSQLGIAGKAGRDILDRFADLHYSVQEIARNGLRDEFELRDEVQKFLFCKI
jgi:FkbM family methyltransferase